MEEENSFFFNFLDRIEDMLIKMIYGISKFTFIKIPKFLKDTLVRLFPTLVKLVKVLFLFILWATIIFGPLIYYVYNTEYNNWFIDSVRKLFNSFYNYFLDVFVYVFDYHSIFYNILNFFGQLFAIFNSDSFFIFAIITWVLVGMVGSIWGIWYIRRKYWFQSIKQFFYRNKSKDEDFNTTSL